MTFEKIFEKMKKLEKALNKHYKSEYPNVELSLHSDGYGEIKFEDYHKRETCILFPPKLFDSLDRAGLELDKLIENVNDKKFKWAKSPPTWR